MIQTQANAANVFTDINGLQGIRTLGKSDQAAALKEVSKQFESMFIGMMLKSMRDASDVFSEDSMFNSPESDFYRNMFDDQLSVSLASGRGTGLADVIHRQLMSQYGLDDEGSGEVDQSRIFERRFTGLSTAMRRVQEELDSLPEKDTATVADSIETSPLVTASGEGSKGQEFASPSEFVAAVYPLAEKIGAEIGVDPKAIVAQAALETGWGKYTIRDSEGRPANNLFGIKAGSSWQGNVVSVKTHEYRQGVKVNEQADFRAYASLEEGLQDYADFLSSSGRYQQAIGEQTEGDAYGHALQRAGYATDPQYGSKIERIYHSQMLNGALVPQAQTTTDLTEQNDG